MGQDEGTHTPRQKAKRAKLISRHALMSRTTIKRNNKVLAKTPA
jgi:hypothetical protein